MRWSIALLLVSLAGILGGAALIGLPALGGAVIFVSICTGVWALLRDGEGRGEPAVREVPPTLENILERARRAG